MEGTTEKLKDDFCAQMSQSQESAIMWIMFQLQDFLRTLFLKAVLMKLPFHTATADFPQISEEA